MVSYDGRRSNSHNKKDDAVDAVERAYRALMPRTDYEVEKTVVDKEEEEQQRLQAMRQAQHAAMFGSGSNPAGWVGKGSDWSAPPKPPEPTTPPTPARPADPRLRWLPKGLHM
jgi:hypothetical protein